MEYSKHKSGKSGFWVCTDQVNCCKIYSLENKISIKKGVSLREDIIGSLRKSGLH